ncbi:MAG: hypothetical protein QW840_02830 [Candidatus Bathyarchaeia archaeon]
MFVPEISTSPERLYALLCDRKALIAAYREESFLRVVMNGEKQKKKLIELCSARLENPHCFGTLRQHVIICNECSKQYECIQEYTSHKLLLAHA